MRRNVLFYNLIVIFTFLSLSNFAQAQQSLVYDFRNNFNESSGQGPAINPLGTGSFVTESIPALSCLDRYVYNFNQNSGVQFDNGASGSFVGTSYTIELYFKFTTTNGFIRLIDFKNRTSDFGLYATNSLLQFYDELTIPTSAFAPNQYVHVVLSRDGATNDVGMYVNGVLLGTFNDDTGVALTDGANVLNFFQDDLVFGNEAQPGRIALLRLYDTAIGDSAVLANFNNLETTSGAVAFTPDVASACLAGNVFNFVNESGTSSSPTYSWEFGDGNLFTGINATHSYSAVGTYNVLLIADNGAGCIDSASSTVEVYLAPTVSLGSDFDVCDGDFAILDPGPGFASYLWSDGTTDPILFVNQAGTYTVTVTDDNGCTGTSQIQIGVLAAPVLDLGSDTTYCFGETVTLSATGGLQGYAWSTGETTPDILVTVAGDYSVEVVDIDGCTATDTVSIAFQPELIVTLPPVIIACDGDQVTLDPGQNFSSYLWSDNSGGTTLIVTVAGLYTVTVTDSTGCSATATSDVFFEPVPLVDLGNDLTICGGTPTILDAGAGFASYLWSDGSTGQTLTVAAAGTYTVTVTQGPGCPGIDEITIFADPPVSLGADIIACADDTVVIDPGAGYITYLWNTGVTTQTIDVTQSGNYTLTVTDINGCINSDEITVTFSTPLVVSLGNDQVICADESATLDAGPGFFDYLWNDGTQSQTLTVSTAGTYTVTVTDLNGCTGTDDVVVVVNPLPVVDLGPDTNICSGNGIILDAGPGMDFYLWNDGSTSQQILVSSAGSYTVTVTDIVGCINSDTITITVVANPVVVLANDTTLCDGDSITVDAGAGFAAYLWDDGSAAQTLTVGSAGVYSVIVTDGNGCTASDDIQVDYHPAVPVPVITQNGNTLQSSSPTGNQWYEVPGGLIPGATGATYEPGQDGVFYVIVTDTNGCGSEPSPDYNFIYVGISEAGSLAFGLHPNPAANMVTLTVGNAVNGTFTVEVIDLAGQVVTNSGVVHGSTVQLDLNGLAGGAYFVRTQSGTQTGIQKLIISK